MIDSRRLASGGLWGERGGPVGVCPGRGLVGWMASARGHRVFFLLVGVWMVNAFDLFMTIQAHSDGMLQEGNPIARAVLPYGTAAVFLFKAGLVAGASLVLCHYRHRVCTEVASAVVLFAYLGVAVRWKLCYEMYDIALSSGATSTDLAWLGGWTASLPIF